jgi:hypothetical protein
MSRFECRNAVGVVLLGESSQWRAALQTPPVASPTQQIALRYECFLPWKEYPEKRGCMLSAACPAMIVIRNRGTTPPPLSSPNMGTHTNQPLVSSLPYHPLQQSPKRTGHLPAIAQLLRTRGSVATLEGVSISKLNSG